MMGRRAWNLAQIRPRARRRPQAPILDGRQVVHPPAPSSDRRHADYVIVPEGAEREGNELMAQGVDDVLSSLSTRENSGARDSGDAERGLWAEREVMRPLIPQDEASGWWSSGSVRGGFHSGERFDKITAWRSGCSRRRSRRCLFVEGDRQWFQRSRAQSRDASRDPLVCGHAINSTRFTRRGRGARPIFAQNPMVLEEPRSGFTRAIPCKAAAVTTLAPLCIIDTSRASSLSGSRDAEDLRNGRERAAGQPAFSQQSPPD